MRSKVKELVAVLEKLTSLDPAPAFMRLDHGPCHQRPVHMALVGVNLTG
jgi:hypothetical protein